MSKKFANDLLEHYKELNQIHEDVNDEQYTDDTLAVQLPKFNKALIVKSTAELIATNFYEVGTMSGPVEKTPVEIYNRQEGVTTTEVAEGGKISKGKTYYNTVTIEAIGFKLQSVLTTEAIEDAQNAGNINIIARAIANLAKDIREEIDERLMQLMVSGAQAGHKDVQKLEKAKDTAEAIVEGIVDVIQMVKKKNYRPDFLLVDPNVFGYLAKDPEFVHADKYGSDKLQQTGFMGKIRGLEVFESNNMLENTAVIGKRRTFGVYKVYVPTQLKGPVYDPDYDKEVYVIRTRAAMKITVGEALGTLKVIESDTP